MLQGVTEMPCTSGSCKVVRAFQPMKPFLHSQFREMRVLEATAACNQQLLYCTYQIVVAASLAVSLSLSLIANDCCASDAGLKFAL